MKKFAFILQVITLTVALPLLSIMELNHQKAASVEKDSGSYTISPAEKSTVSKGAMNKRI